MSNSPSEVNDSSSTSYFFYKLGGALLVTLALTILGAVSFRLQATNSKNILIGLKQGGAIAFMVVGNVLFLALVILGIRHRNHKPSPVIKQQGGGQQNPPPPGVIASSTEPSQPTAGKEKRNVQEKIEPSLSPPSSPSQSRRKSSSDLELPPLALPPPAIVEETPAVVDAVVEETPVIIKHEILTFAYQAAHPNTVQDTDPQPVVMKVEEVIITSKRTLPKNGLKETLQFDLREDLKGRANGHASQVPFNEIFKSQSKIFLGDDQVRNGMKGELGKKGRRDGYRRTQPQHSLMSVLEPVLQQMEGKLDRDGVGFSQSKEAIASLKKGIDLMISFNQGSAVKANQDRSITGIKNFANIRFEKTLDEENLNKIFKAIDDELNMNGIIFFCEKESDESAAFLVLYIASRAQCTFEEAHAYVSERREIASYKEDSFMKEAYDTFKEGLAQQAKPLDSQ